MTEPQPHCLHFGDVKPFSAPHPKRKAWCCWCKQEWEPTGYRREHGYAGSPWTALWPIGAGDPCLENRSQEIVE